MSVKGAESFAQINVRLCCITNSLNLNAWIV